MKNIGFLFLLLIGCASQNNDIESDQLTIEGFITENAFSEVLLTNSLPFYGVIDSLEIAKTIEGKAKVEVVKKGVKQE